MIERFSKTCAIGLAIASILIIAIVAGFSLFADSNSKSIPSCRDGILVISELDFEKQNFISLDGGWEFYWNKLYSYQDFAKGETTPDSIVKVPNVWTRYKINGESLPGSGYATYRLKVKACDASKPISMRIDTMSTSYNMFVNEHFISSNGLVGTSKQTSKPEYTPKVVTFKPESNEFEIIIQLSNFTHARGGIWYEIKMGSPEKIQKLNTIIIFKDAFLIGSLLILALYYIIIFLNYRYDKSSVYFAILNILLIIRTMLYGSNSINIIFPNISFSFRNFLNYMTLIWCVVVLNIIIEYFFTRQRLGIFSRILLVYATASTIFVALTPISIYTNYTYYFEAIGICIFSIVLVTSFKVYLRKQGQAVIVLIGGFILLFTGILDVLYQLNVIYYAYGELSSFGMFIFMVLLSFLMAQRIAASFYEAKNLSVRLGESLEKEKALSDRLAQMDKLKDDFLANTSHELRTPLNGVINITQSIIMGVAGKLNERQKKELEIVVASSRRLYNLINNILDVSSIKNNALKLFLKPVDVRSVLINVISILEYLKGEKDLIFENRLAMNTPFVLCDEERLKQIMFNLLGNALKFTDKGHITVGCELQDNMLRLYVRDTGVGIPEDKFECIFNSFEQVDDSINRKYEGTGLGLGITKQLIELQGGTIWVESETGTGSCFYFTLPIAPKHFYINNKEDEGINNTNIKAESNIKSLKENISEDKYSKYDILAVDDDAVNLSALSNSLKLEGYKVKTAYGGNTALKLLQNGAVFDLVILDVMMPGISGFDVLRQIRKKYLPVELPVLLLSARSLKEDMATGFSLGANDYIIKPYEHEELAARVKSLVELKKVVNRLVSMELSFLQAQIKPHFIFNTLNVISSLSIADPVRAKELILDFSDYLHASFSFEGKSGMTTLKRELDLVRAYVSIEHARFEERLEVIYNIENGVDGIIPMLCIQPLVENSIRHGLMKKIDGGKVEISLHIDGDNIYICVKDNGIGMSDDRIHEVLNDLDSRTGVGMKNIHRRLVTLYGRGLSVVSKPEKGTQVNFLIPIMRGEANEGFNC